MPQKNIWSWNWHVLSEWKDLKVFILNTIFLLSIRLLHIQSQRQAKYQFPCRVDRIWSLHFVWSRGELDPCLLAFQSEEKLSLLQNLRAYDWLCYSCASFFLTAPHLAAVVVHIQSIFRVRLRKVRTLRSRWLHNAVSPSKCFSFCSLEV